MNKIILSLLLPFLISCNRPSPKVGEIWRFEQFKGSPMDFKILSFRKIEGEDQVQTQDLDIPFTGEKNYFELNFFTKYSHKVGEATPIQHFRMMDTGRGRK